MTFIRQAGGSSENTDTFTPTLGQTLFVLSAAPSDANDVKFIVNGSRYPSSEFSVLGTSVTWLNLFSLDASDTVLVTYFF